MRLRGIKQYHLHKKADSGQVPSNQKKIASSIKPLPAGSRFSGRIRFNNLTEAELGLLIWSLGLEENSMANVGKAKPYGYGAVRIKVAQVRKFEPARAYDLSAPSNLESFSEMGRKSLISAYKDEVNRELGSNHIDQQKSVRAFFMMKNADHILPEQETRYMSLDDKAGEGKHNFAKQRRENAILPSIEKVYGGQKKR